MSKAINTSVPGAGRLFLSALGSRLARRQVRLVLVAALVLGVLLSSLQILWEYQSRASVMEKDLKLLIQSTQNAAAAAAYQLDDGLAVVVCSGLVAHPYLDKCRLVVGNGVVLGEASNETPPLYLSWTGFLFGGVHTESLSLNYRSDLVVGQLMVHINPAVATNEFLVSALIVIAIGVVRALLLSVVLFMVFYVLVTRPVVRLARFLTEVDPNQYQPELEDWTPSRADDELRELEVSALDMIDHSRQRIDELNRTKVALQDMNRSLETRVDQRTRALERAMRQLERQAQTDPLTGLQNRRQFHQAAASFTCRWERFGEPFAVMLLDLDHFKSINDRHGHDLGDQVLQAVAATFKLVCREGDLAARFGGEEFVVVARIAEQYEAGLVAERLRAAIEGVTVDGLDMKLSVSIGVAVPRRRDESLNDMIKRADTAMYKAKAAGRNRVALDEGPADRVN